MAGTISRIIRSLPLLLGSFERRAVAQYGLTSEDAKAIRRHLAKRDLLSHAYALHSAFAPAVFGALLVAIALLGFVSLLPSLGVSTNTGWSWLIPGGASGTFVVLQITFYTHARFVLIDRRMRRCIIESLCPACDYQLCGQIPTEEGYVRCPECGVVVPIAEWFLPPAEETASEAARHPTDGG